MSTQTYKKLITLTLLGVMGIAPALAYAHNDKDKSNRGRKKQEDTHCVRAFGHLFAPGYLKNWGGNAQVDLSDNCFRPFGIIKKLRIGQSTASTTPDTTPPVISNVSVNLGTSTAVIVWKTNERSDSTVFWNTTAGFDTASSTTASTTHSTLVKTHVVPLENLTASTTYYFKIRSEDASGNATTSAESSFTTLISVN